MSAAETAMQASWVLQLDERRHAVSLLATLGAGAILWALAHTRLPAAPEPAPQRLMALILETVPAALQAAPPPAAPKAVPRPVTPAPAAAAPSPTPATPAQAAPPSNATNTSSAMPAAESFTRAAAPSTAPQAAPAPAPATPAPPSHLAVEASYVNQLRALLDATKRYPTGREASLRRPQGKVVVWFVLNRAGTVQELGIEQASDFHLLDQAALSTVRRASFPPIPQAAWPATGTHRFTATLDFIPPG